MAPLFFKLLNGRSLMIVSDTEAHLDGHTIITHTYSIFLDKMQRDSGQVTAKENTLHLTRHADPDYFGYITFERSNELYSYTPDGTQQLTRSELEEIIYRISYIRDNPSLWQHMDNL